jgi:2-dehydro-3-deoxyphosphogluconate aldolase/(4S)-4-hydroxy-2-oxoglutarate aldolase
VSYRWEFARAMLRQGVVGIVRTATAESAVAGARTLLDAGLHSVEVTLTNSGALQAIERLVAEYPEATIGAGTVLDEASAVAAIRAGARFLVSPNLNPAVIRAANRYGAASLPAAGSVTEIVNALEAGADAVKLFPASAFTPRWVSDVRAALPQVPLVPTGGIGAEDVPVWLAAGAVACGIGASLLKGTDAEIRARISGLLQGADSD